MEVRRSSPSVLDRMKKVDTINAKHIIVKDKALSRISCYFLPQHRFYNAIVVEGTSLLSGLLGLLCFPRYLKVK